MKYQNDRVANKLLQVETAVEGIIDRINRLEKTLNEFHEGRKNLMYVDESKALLSSHETDAEYLENEALKLGGLYHTAVLKEDDDELSSLRNK